MNHPNQTVEVALMNDKVVVILAFAYQLHQNFVCAILTSEFSNKLRTNFNILVTSLVMKSWQVIENLFF